MCARSTTDHGSTASSNARSGVDASTAVRGAGAGAAAFVASYVLAFLAWTYVSLPEPDTFGEAFDQAVVAAVRDGVASWKAAGYVLFNAQFVEIAYEGPFSEATFSLVELASGSLLAALYVVPPLALAVAGYAVASSPDVRGTSQSAVAGALVAAGYVVLAVLGAVAFTAEADGQTLTVPLANALIVAGVVYPVVFGAVGGVVADATRA